MCQEELCLYGCSGSSFQDKQVSLSLLIFITFFKRVER